MRVFLPAREYSVEDSAELEQGGYVPDHSNGGGSGGGGGGGSRPSSSSSSRARAGGSSDNLPNIEGDGSGGVSAPRSSRNELSNGDDFKDGHSLSTISEGGSMNSSQREAMTSRSLSSQLQSTPSPQRSVTWEQEWDLAFGDARVEQRFNDYVTPRVVTAERFTGGASAAGGAAALAFNASAAAVAVAAQLIPLLGILVLPLLGALFFPLSWSQTRVMLVPPLRLLAALIVGPWLKRAGFGIFHSLPLGLLALMHPLTLRFHIPLQLLCLWSSVNTGIWEFILGFLFLQLLSMLSSGGQGGSL